jgi:hypothetical protein
LCAVPEHTISSTTVQATVTPNKGEVTCHWSSWVWGTCGISQSQDFIGRPGYETWWGRT